MKLSKIIRETKKVGDSFETYIFRVWVFGIRQIMYRYIVENILVTIPGIECGWRAARAGYSITERRTILRIIKKPKKTR